MLGSKVLVTNKLAIKHVLLLSHIVTADAYNCKCLLPCRIAMATRENLQSQKGMLYSVTDKVSTLASILLLHIRNI